MSKVLYFVIFIGALLLFIRYLWGLRPPSTVKTDDELFTDLGKLIVDTEKKYTRTPEEDIKQIKIDISKLYKMCEGIDIKHKAHTMGRGALFERVVKVSGDLHILNTKVRELELNARNPGLNKSPHDHDALFQRLGQAESDIRKFEDMQLEYKMKNVESLQQYYVDLVSDIGELKDAIRQLRQTD